MSLVGNLAEMSLPVVLQFLSRAGGSGKLTLTSVNGSGLIVFRKGMVIYAASNSVRETFGSLLASRGLVDDEILRKGLEIQHRAREERRLGTILIEMGAISEEMLEAVIRQQAGAVVGELCHWREGFFRFDAMEVEEHGEVEVDARELLLEHGIDAGALAAEAAWPPEEPEEPGREARIATAEAASPSTGRPAPESEPVARPLEAAGRTEAPREAARPSAAPESVSLRSLMSSPLSPWLTAEVAQKIMQPASEVFRRCVLFAVRGGYLVAMGGFGIEPRGGSTEEGIRAIRLALEEPSVLSYTVGAAETYRGPLHGIAGDQAIVAALGGATPAQVVVLPIEVTWEVVALVYGDNFPDTEPIGSVADLELAIMDVELAMEQAMASDSASPTS